MLTVYHSRYLPLIGRLDGGGGRQRQPGGPTGGARCSTTQLSDANPPLTHTTTPQQTTPSPPHTPIKFSPSHTSNTTHASPALSYSPSTIPLPLQHSSVQPVFPHLDRAIAQRFSY